MSEYIQILFPEISADQKEILIAELSELGFEGFEETENELKAFAPADQYNETDVNIIASKFKAQFIKTIIGETNWNEVWESNFDPVIIDDFAAIRADFHKPVKNVRHEIVITPKMSFGTGHHATTFMMVQQMERLEFREKVVFDFGTGTGILAILAEKLGAGRVVAIDNDDWSIENAAENIKHNDCSRIELKKADVVEGIGAFDIILANINKNVILDNLASLKAQLKAGGTILLSGLLVSDKDDIFRRFVEYSLQLEQTAVRDNWLCLKVSC